MTMVDGIQRFEQRMVDGMRASFDEARRQYRMQRKFRRTYDELNALSDRELNDLGIARASIRDVARSACEDV